MNKKELKKQYIAHCENTAPDMDKLWEKIESGLEEKTESGVTSKPAKTVDFHKITVWCTACAAVLIAVPAFIIGANISKTSESFTMSQNEAYAGDMITFAPAADGAFIEEEEPAPAGNNDMADNDVKTGFTASLPEMVYYEELPLAETVVSNVLFLTAEPFGDEFFVEEKVLAETDIIVDAVVQSYYSSEGGTVCYVLSAEDSDQNDMGSITVESASPYTLKMSREYILPLKETEDGYRLVFENAPQIECTLDGGVIFHNGWRSLDENSCWVSYPKNTVDDFFYDRMRFSYTDGMASLTDKWKTVKNYAKED
ncbi:MAG: hypothetical protein K2N71_10635 [Oscillospiraceae bacterium]|nr:hypothetical protein [Oscillospiraceae bacterium]